MGRVPKDPHLASVCYYYITKTTINFKKFHFKKCTSAHSERPSTPQDPRATSLHFRASTKRCHRS